MGVGLGREYHFSYYSEVKKARGGAFLTQQCRIYMFSTVSTPKLGQLLKNSRETYVILLTNSTFWLLSTPTLGKDKNQ